MDDDDTAAIYRWAAKRAPQLRAHGHTYEQIAGMLTGNVRIDPEFVYMACNPLKTTEQVIRWSAKHYGPRRGARR